MLVSHTVAHEFTQTRYAQRLEPLDARLRRDGARDEREDGGARLPKARHPPDGPGEEARGEDAAGVVHDDGVDGPEDDADEGDCDSAADERGDEPHHELEAKRGGVEVSAWVA